MFHQGRTDLRSDFADYTLGCFLCSWGLGRLLQCMIITLLAFCGDEGSVVEEDLLRSGCACVEVEGGLGVCRQNEWVSLEHHKFKGSRYVDPDRFLERPLGKTF